MNVFTWLGIFLCVSQSAMFSGLNLAFFSISKLRLEIESAKDNRDAQKVLALRKDSNFLLTTILWGNVGINVLLTLLSESVLAGVTAFFFSTCVITFFGEIIPQAYFSRHAIKSASLLSPVLRLYQILLYPVAKPTSLILNKWLGFEAIIYFREEDLQELIKMHIQSESTDIGSVEGTGALNFLSLDDLPIEGEGEVIDPRSILSLPFEGDRPVFPPIIGTASDEFLKQVHLSNKRWVIITNPVNEPKVVINSDSFLRDALFEDHPFNPYVHCHRPIIITKSNALLGETILRLNVHPKREDDDVIDEDIIIFWGKTKRIITGSDILGRLLKNIVQKEKVYFRKRINGNTS
jgi:hypothetical protein